MAKARSDLDRLFVTGGGVLGPAPRENALIGTRVGPFEIVDIIGRGGMSTVYLAERRDGTFEQRVAIKVLEARSVGERFARERRILARLDHPAIARIFDGGTLDDGRPYLVMEYVAGDPADVAFARDAVSFEQRLDWFEAICAALGAAHAEGVIHQDLKPDNILIDRHGHPKLLDFGLGAMQDDRDRGRQSLMTPRFAAPEQFAGEPGTPATDIFQLGLLLYLAATGRHPAGECDDLAALRERVAHLPLAPASEVAARSARPRIDRELDLIIDRCLQPIPADRYASAAELLADVHAWRAGKPTSAGAGQPLHRVRRVWRHHRRALLAGGVVVLLLAVTANWVAQRLAREQARSRAMSELAGNVVAPTGTDRIASSSFELGGGAVSDDPELEQELTFLTAQALLNAGRQAEAIGMLEAVLARSRGSFEDTDRPARLVHLLGEAYRRDGRRADAERLLRMARASLLRTDPALWLRNADSLAAVLVQQGRWADARALLAELAAEAPAAAGVERGLQALSGLLQSGPGDCDPAAPDTAEGPLAAVLGERCSGAPAPP